MLLMDSIGYACTSFTLLLFPIVGVFALVEDGGDFPYLKGKMDLQVMLLMYVETKEHFFDFSASFHLFHMKKMRKFCIFLFTMILFHCFDL